MQHLFFTHHYCREVIPQPDGNAIVSHVFFRFSPKDCCRCADVEYSGDLSFYLFNSLFRYMHTYEMCSLISLKGKNQYSTVDCLLTVQHETMK